jgi:serine/threonine protein kinase
VSHDHLAAVYAAEEHPDTAYAVTEWAGGVTIGDRISAGEPIPLDDFLPNAAGLADALARLHAADIVHGAIGPGAILYSAAHPAKLSPFATLEGDRRRDTSALADTLVAGLAGGPTDLAPSQLAEGLSRSVDSALRAAKSGRLDAAGLAAALRAAPSPAAAGRGPSWSWRLLGAAAGLFVIALVVIALGFALEADTASPLLFPVGEPAPPPTVATPTPPDVPQVEAAAPAAVSFRATATFDPFGDGAEHDRDIGLMTDGRVSTRWQTERYFDPLQLIKPGVGVVFAVAGPVGRVTVVGAPSTAISVAWAADAPATFDDWQQLASMVLAEGPTSVTVPRQTDGNWLLWLTDLPVGEDGESHVGSIAEVGFEP